ncbi:MAG: SOS response-associated peptidase [Flavobacteriales bacterium]|nr:SOS response-associated peptidase family protein [Flavobacteriales bacterium]
MCYTVAYLTKKKITYAKRAGASDDEVKELQLQLEELTATQPAMYHISGFAHPKLICFTRDDGPQFQLVRWGLIPHWVKDHAQAAIMGRQTLNARGGTIFEKPAFRIAAQHRCLVLVDGFFEFFHFAKRTFPYHIRLKDDAVMALGGITSVWQDPETGSSMNTLSIVTTEANPLMAGIHNNPKAQGPRMPFIVPKELDEQWLSTRTENDRISSLIMPFPELDLEAFTVAPLLGKHASPNTKEAIAPFEYPELALLG